MSKISVAKGNIMEIVGYAILILVVSVGIVYVIGMFMPKEHVANRTTVINAPVETVWKTVTDIENQTVWRKDLEKVEVIEQTENTKVWTEYPQKGRPITFREVQKTPYTRYKIEIVPRGAISGYWLSEFSQTDEGVVFESKELGKIHSPILRVLAYLFFDMGKTIEEYQHNLKYHLENNI